VGAPPQKKIKLINYFFEPLAPPKGKKMDTPECMISHLIGCMEILFPKVFVAMFRLG
jgi:hypothetical protein